MTQSILLFLAVFCTLLIVVLIIDYVKHERKPKTTLTTLPPEPTDKGHWWDGIHEMD